MKKIREGYKMTELGEIPVDWEVNRLEEICEFLDGKRKPIKAEDRLLMQGNIPYYGASGIIDWVNDYLFDDELILLGEDGENIKSRNVPLAFKVNGKCWVNNHAHVLKIKNNESDDIDYITYSLENKDYSSYVIGSAQPKLNQAECKKFLLLRPILKEQRKISLILTSVDEQIEITDNLIEKTKELKKGLMQKLLTKGIGHDRFKDTEIGMIPEVWEVRKLGEICNLKGRIGWRGYTKEDLRDHGPLVIGATQISSNNKIDLSNPTYISTEKYEESPEIKVNLGDIILVKTGNTIGKVAIIKDYIGEATINPNTVLMKEIRCNNNFLYYIIASHLVQNVLNSLITVGAQPSINQDKLNKIIVPIPTLGEQEKISLILSSVDEEIDQYESKKEKLQELKKGLMQKLLTGSVRVKV